MHHPPLTDETRNEIGDELGGVGTSGSADNAFECGPVNAEAVQQVLAAKWALEVINNQSIHSEQLKIGKEMRCYHLGRWQLQRFNSSCVNLHR